MKRSYRWLLVMAVIFLALGAFLSRRGDSPYDALTRFIGAFAIPIALYAWCQADIAEHRFSYPAGTPILVAWLFPLGLPIYFLRTRPFFRAMVSLVVASILYVLYSLLMWVGQYARAHLAV
jgi:hypothetical protein